MSPGSEAVDNLKALVECMAKALVESPDAVRVEAIEGDPPELELHVAASDLGRVIGKQGRTARAMRNILSAACAKLEREYSLEIAE
jgi:predicted RNA-binding protein YlqC (UPF0109 family)